jgi:hypothetical protein
MSDTPSGQPTSQASKKDNKIFPALLIFFLSLIAIVVGCVLIYNGVQYIEHDPNKNTILVDAIITAPNCISHQTAYRKTVKTSYECNLNVSYTIPTDENASEEHSYTATIQTDSKIYYKAGQIVKVRISESNYNDARLDNIPAGSGYMLLVTGIILLFIILSFNGWLVVVKSQYGAGAIVHKLID